MRDPIVDEVREIREAYARQFDFDLDAISRDLRRQQQSAGGRVVVLPKRPVQQQRLDIKAKSMPVIARFYGIAIKMYFKEHGVPHFHAIYGEFNGVFDIQTVEMIEGDLPPRARKMVRDWATTYRDELMKMWKKRDYKPLPGLE
jgi:Domain of unknown function (DUF4160)